MGENKQTGSTDVWQHPKTVYKRVSSTAWKQASCIFIHRHIIKKLFFPGNIVLILGLKLYLVNVSTQT